MFLTVFAIALLSGPTQTVDPGRRAFQRCAACHAIDGSEDLPGPDLRRVYGRRIGTDSYPYSAAMTAAGRRGLTWDEARLNRFLVDPEAVIPGTSMPSQGGTAAERAAVIDYLKRLSRTR